MKIPRIIIVFFLFAACNAPQAVYDYDQQIDFSNYDTYQIYPELLTGLSQLDERRLLSSLENALPEENLSSSANPDLLVNVYTEEFRERSGNTLGVGVGGGGGNVGVGVSGGIPIGGAKNFLRLTFDFIDRETDALVWQAIVESPFDPDASPEERQKKFDRIVKEALEGFPPKR